MITLHPLSSDGIQRAQQTVKYFHYLHKMVHSKCAVEGYAVRIAGLDGCMGLLLFGRPQAPRCKQWYGSVAAWQAGQVECTNWQVLNLNRVCFNPVVQVGGRYYSPDYLPGEWRNGRWHSTLITTAIEMALDRVVVDYLLARPPCYLEEPYELRWCLSYSDPQRHAGTIYQWSHFRRYRANKRGLITWRKRLRPLTPAEDALVQQAARWSARSQTKRAERFGLIITQPALLEVA